MNPPGDVKAQDQPLREEVGEAVTAEAVHVA